MLLMGLIGVKSLYDLFSSVLQDIPGLLTVVVVYEQGFVVDAYTTKPFS